MICGPGLARGRKRPPRRADAENLLGDQDVQLSVGPPTMRKHGRVRSATRAVAPRGDERAQELELLRA